MALFKKKQNDATLYDFLNAEIQNWPAHKGITAKDRQVFIKEFLHGETLTDLEKRPMDEAAETVKMLWTAFQKRRFEDIEINVTEDSFGQADRVDITIMQRQIPFITDSILNLLRQSHISVTVMANATIKVRRDDDGNLLSVHEDADFGPDLQQDKILHLQCEHRGEGLDTKALRQNISNILRDVHAAVEDWRPMQGQIADTIGEMENCQAPLEKDEAYEVAQFLSFLKEGNFTFLGYREHDIRRAKNSTYFDVIEKKSLGILRDKGYLLFDDKVSDDLIPAEVQKTLCAPQPPMMILKANRQSTVHRNVQMDVIFVKRYNAKGEVDGLRLFSGLFTAQCYALPAEQIPYIKRKLKTVLNKAGYEENTHSWRAMKHVLESYPRDELFQIDNNELYEQAIGIHRLDNRPDVDVFVRKDTLQRYFSVLVYLPKDQYNTSLRIKTQDILEEVLHGRVIGHHMTVDEKPLARLQYTVAAGDNAILPNFDLQELRARLVDACTPWFERLKIATLERFGKKDTQKLLQNLSHAFSVSYKDQISVEHALEDLQPIQQVMHDKDLHIALLRHDTDAEGVYRIKLYVRNEEAVLSELLPMLDSMGFHCLHEYSYHFMPNNDLPDVWMHELVGTIDNFNPDTLDNSEELFAEAFERIWRRKVPADAYNSLVLAAGLTSRQANIYRALARYLELAGYPLSKRYMSQVLAKYADVTRLLRDLFIEHLDPTAERKASEMSVANLVKEIESHLEKVEKLDEDRVLRSLLNLTTNILRTNFFQTDENGKPLDILVLKFNARNLNDLPQPRPFREMFVYSTRFEAVHLRGGPIARGGIRWSDRYEDFRTEILGLVKAQQVKNAVIVPVGAKGGFICKNQPNLKTPQERSAEGIACYQLMVNTFLSITDNLVDGKVVPPKNTPRLDGDDPYLVVAADKGTASFSDIANAISLERNFWLGDAFASGGSVGYDHKKMGITARGAWECIKRNFRELGKDIQTEDFTVAGVGDMSGDVFGNGMLLSKHIRLVAAYDHRHIFVDPNPDAAKSFAERQRLFDKPASSWMDYDPKLLSKGGAIFSRQDKSLTLTPEIMALLDIKNERVTPNELMTAILKANVELMYFGGIGTYVKATSQSHDQVGDKGNDAIRINASELRCKVLGEGANLPVTQAGRIEFAQLGGKIEPDFIDNSAGVDTSDHEVNIKILLQPMVNNGKLKMDARNKLLESMTDEVAGHVLKNNYDQSLTLSLQERRGMEDFSNHVEFMRHLEREGQLSRQLEGLPNDETIISRTQRHQGLTRPELSVITAYSKMDLYNKLIDSKLPDDPEMVHQLMEYFPDALQEKYKAEIQGHKLKREIIGTEVANAVINKMGPTFVFNEMNRTGLDADVIVRAWMIVRSVFGFRTLWAEIDKLDNKIPADLQLELYQDMVNVMEQGVQWFLQRHLNELSFDKLTPLYREQPIKLHDMADRVPQVLKTSIAEKQEKLDKYPAISDTVKQGFLQMPLLLPACDVIYLTKQSKAKADDIGAVYFTLNDKLHLTTIATQLEALPADTAYAQEAIEGLKTELQSIGTELTTLVLSSGKKIDIDQWLAERKDSLEAIDAMGQDMERSGTADLALLTVVVQRLRRFVNQNKES